MWSTRCMGRRGGYVDLTCQYRKYPLFKVTCCHSGIIDKNSEKNFKCYKNYDRRFILLNELNNHLCTKVLKRTRNDHGESEINILVYL